MRSLTRRETLALGAGSAAVAMMIEIVPLAATPDEAMAEVAKFTGGKAAQSGRITIGSPEIAENGTTVPLSVAVDHPMSPESYVSDVLVVAPGNPRPRLATFHFTALSGRAEAATRIRLAATQDIVVVARTSDGQFFTAQKQVKVTIGGCGG